MDKMPVFSKEDVNAPGICHGLLFLPALQLSVPPTKAKEAYADTIAQTIERLVQEFHEYDANLVTRLDICLLFDGGSKASRSSLFQDYQKLIAEIYTISCLCASRSKVELDIAGGIDVRVYAIDAPLKDNQQINLEPEDVAATAGPLSTIRAFKLSRAGWLRAFIPASTALRNAVESRDWGNFWSSCEHEYSIQYLGHPTGTGGLPLEDTILDNLLSSKVLKMHTKVAVGGTFDHLHLGHKLLLTAAIFVAQPGPADREITIGITGDELLVNKKHASALESWDIRQQKAADFVESILVFHADVESVRKTEDIDNPGVNGRIVRHVYQVSPGSGKITINYTRISDPFGPTITDESITALVVSAETRAGGKAVNDKRLEKGWAALEVFEVDVLDPSSVTDTREVESTNFATKISSTEIRRRLAQAEPTHQAQS